MKALGKFERLSEKGGNKNGKIYLRLQYAYRLE
jgi:hypothetical protein